MLSDLIAKVLPIFPKSLVYVFAKKYIAGPTLDDAIRVTKELMKLNGMSTIDVLGEFVETKDAALHEVKQCHQVIEAIHTNNLNSYLSIKPTSVGLGIDYDFGYENIKNLVAKAKSYGLRARLDMENSPYTDITLKVYKQLRQEGFDNVGIVLQAYMKRSESDVKSLIEYKPNVRLCKGIYNESPSIAFKGKDEIRDNYKKLLRLMFDNNFYIGIATHDEPLIQDAENEIKRRNLSVNDYEFQMLLGVREEKRNELLQKGHHLRVYVPFGEDWFGYSTRRLKENPQMVSHIVKSIFGINK
jgi:proline dehydrogenase